MSTLVQNVAKVKSAYDALSASIEAKGVSVPAGTKLTGMPALVDQIQTGGGSEPTPNSNANLREIKSDSLVVPKVIAVDTAKAKNFSSFLTSNTTLTSLTLPAGFGQAGLDFTNCFYGCQKLKSLTLPDGFGQVATSLNRCFQNCWDLTSLTLPDGCGQVATDMAYCFNNCQSLISLHLPTGFGQAVSSIYQQVNFQYCSSLTTITGNPNFKVSLNLSPCPNLTHDSIMVVINGLQTVTETQTLTLGTDNLAKLSDAEKQIATNKGWTLA